MEDGYLGLSGILKAGITPENVQLNGTLTPKQGRAFADAIVDNSQLLRIITMDISGKLTKTRSALSVATGLLTRHVPGATLSETQLKKLDIVGSKLDMTNGVTLQFMINDDTLNDNLDNPKFEAEQYAGATKAFSNDIVYLGWIGIADNDLVDAPFNELAKGWLAVAAEDINDVKKGQYIVIADDEGATIEAGLEKLCDIAHEDITDDMDIFLNQKDLSVFRRYISKTYKDMSLLEKGELLEWDGRTLRPQKGIPRGTLLGTPKENMVVGFSKQIDRKRWYDNDRSAIRYKFVVRPDYEFDIKKYVALVTPAP